MCWYDLCAGLLGLVSVWMTGLVCPWRAGVSAEPRPFASGTCVVGVCVFEEFLLGVLLAVVKE
jgi:hypothetical protein